MGVFDADVSSDGGVSGRVFMDVYVLMFCGKFGEDGVGGVGRWASSDLYIDFFLRVVEGEDGFKAVSEAVFFIEDGHDEGDGGIVCRLHL